MHVQGPSVAVLAPAKLNLALAVGAPLTAGPKVGFHPIASWFVSTSLTDELRVVRLSENSRSSYDIRFAPDTPKPSPIDWPVEKDLCVRAHRLVERHVARALPIQLTLEKRIPVGGGLGGGSSDAAAALVAIDRLYDLKLGFPTLRALSQELGSDIAYFLDEQGLVPDADTNRPQSAASSQRLALRPRPALVTGCGEVIERLPSRELPHALLLVPPFGCPTGPVYKAFDALLTASGGTSYDEFAVRSAIRSWSESGRVDNALLGNALAAPACQVEPRLLAMLKSLSRSLPSPVHVTGSGSTMFTLLEPEHDPAELARAASDAHPEIVPVLVELDESRDSFCPRTFYSGQLPGAL